MSPEIKRIGIGIGDDAGNVIASAQSVAGKFLVICYCRPSTVDAKTLAAGPVTIAEHEEPEEALVTDLMAGTIDAAVRGTLPSNATLKALKRETGADHLERIALLQTARGKKFLLAPVGVDEGWTVQEKLALIKKGKDIARRFGLPQDVGILSGGRFGDVGRHPQTQNWSPG
jgi:predicted methyltransferase MtxX (methanogen marker protein 4)